MNNARIAVLAIAIGAGGTQNCNSSNNGVGWTAGATTGLLGDLVAVTALGSNFIVATGAGGRTAPLDTAP